VLRRQFKHTVGSDVDVLPGLFWGYSGGPPTAAQLQTFATALAPQWQNSVGLYFSPAVTFNQVIVQDISTPTGFEGSANASYTGTRAGGILPAGTCVNVNFTVARRYRGGKPRVYLPVGTETDLASPQKWTTAFTGLVSNEWNALITWINGNPPTGLTNFTQVNVSYYQHVWQSSDSKGNPVMKPLYRSPSAFVDQVTGYSVAVPIGSQRRRTRGGG
jgi:hypothetical protein